jgi:aarF domain-containing kinase
LALTSRKKEDAHTVVLASDSSAADELSWYTRLYLELCLASVEWSGAAVIKLMQWLSSRPDLVGPEFCAIFSKLQDDTTPHAFRYTNQILTKAYGENWQDHIRLEGLIGSGCIGQVYKGYIQNDDGTEQAVAVKVLHPSIEEDIDVDLDILRGVAKLIPLISRPLSWLNPEGAVEEFGRMLVSQLDLRHEARNLQKFCQNFEGVDYIEFPRLVEEFQPTQHCLVETFLEGLPILEFAKSNRDNPTLLHQLCIHGIAIVCRMIFILNHCHGDLHPGNVMVTPHNKIGLLDFGIVNEYTEEDHDLIVSVLTSFIHHKGRQAARYMMDNSNVRLQGKDAAVDEEGFIEKIDAMAQKAAGKDYLMENLGTYISQICNAAAEHHVLMNQAFVSAALAIKVQEGIVLSLDPSLQIWRVANPIILEGEAIRKAKQLGETMSSKSSWFSRLFHNDASAAVEKN